MPRHYFKRRKKVDSADGIIHTASKKIKSKSAKGKELDEGLQRVAVEYVLFVCKLAEVVLERVGRGPVCYGQLVT